MGTQSSSSADEQTTDADDVVIAADADLTEAQKIRRLPWLVAGDTLNIMFVLLTFSGSVFILYLDELGLNTGQIGLMLAFVPLLGVLAPIVSPISTRFGYKRIFVLMRAVRNIPIAFLLFTPVVLNRYGETSAFQWVAGCILLFALFRVIGETGSFSWRKDIVPDGIRGKFAAISSMTTTIASILVILLAGYVIDQGEGLTRFMVLIGIGVIFGVLSIFFFMRAPAESKLSHHPSRTNLWSGTKESLRNHGFLLFLLVLGLATVGTQMSISFVPLFMKEQVGLSEGIVVLLSIGTYIGALFTSYFWGWAADRYSSRPIMQVSLVLLILLPISWMFLPRHDPASAVLAMGIAFIMGIATLAWQISWTRYLYVNAVPEHNRTAYLAVYFAWLSLVIATGPLLAGRILEFTSVIEPHRIGLLHIDPYTPLFLISIFLFVATIVIVPRLKTEQNVTFRRFAGLFLRGNPIRAMRLLIQYNHAGDEMTRIVTTERMGDIQSPLNTQELIEALQDPSFNVRYEAIHSIGRMSDSPELVTALIGILEGGEPELGMVTARALGRLGDPRAIPALRASLDSPYDLIKVNGARALAQLDDVESIPHIREMLESEPNFQLKVGYASALGRLGDAGALPEFFRLLIEAEEVTDRGELGLAIARLTSDEEYYLRHWQAFRTNFDTSVAQALLDLQKPMRRAGHEDLAILAETCSSSYGSGEYEAGAEQLSALLLASAELQPEGVLKQALRLSAQALTQVAPDRYDIVLVALHALDAAWSQEDGSDGDGGGEDSES